MATEELGLIASRLNKLASAVAEPPVPLPVKLIGDAAMLVSTNATAMVGAALRMVEAADLEGEDFPQLRAGIAHGSVHVQAGDYYGRPVNLASRLTAIARPGTVLIDSVGKAAAGDRFAYSFAGEHHLKGFDSRISLYRVRRAAPESQRPRHGALSRDFGANTKNSPPQGGRTRLDCSLFRAVARKKLQRETAELWRLVRRQHGVVTRGQLLELGFGSEAIEHRIAQGRLHRIWRGVYAVGRPEISREARWAAAVLSCGREALLSHRSAAVLWGL